MDTLHLVNRAASSCDALQRCLHLASPGDTVLLIEDGVYSGLPTVFSGLEQNHPVTTTALASDVDARGLNGRLTDTIEIVDYEGFVELTELHNPVVSWF